MKKFIAIALGLTFILSGVFLWVTDAHIYSRHAWRNVNQTNFRPFSDRLGSFSYRMPTRHRFMHHDLRFTHPSIRANTDLYAPYRPATVSYKDQKLLRRIQNPELYPRYMNERQSQVYVVRHENYNEVKGLPFSSERNVYLYNPNNNYKAERTTKVEDDFIEKLRSYQSRHYSDTPYRVNPPSGFYKTNGVYRSKNVSLAFRITENQKGVCHPSNFEMCAVNYRKGFVDEQGLLLSSEVKRIVWPRHTVNRTFDRFPVVTEAFYARGFGMENVYYLMSALNPTDGSTVHIEAVANADDGYQSAEIIEKVFESFQFQM